MHRVGKENDEEESWVNIFKFYPWEFMRGLTHNNHFMKGDVRRVKCF